MTKFGTAINCMDGRTQTPVRQYLKKHYGVDMVDRITEPGPDKLLCDFAKMKAHDHLDLRYMERDEIILEVKREDIKKKIDISVGHHGSKIIAIIGHHDCAGNPVSKKEHIAQIKKGVKVVKSWNTGAEVIGLWVNEKMKAERVDSGRPETAEAESAKRGLKDIKNGRVCSKKEFLKKHKHLKSD